MPNNAIIDKSLDQQSNLLQWKNQQIKRLPVIMFVYKIKNIAVGNIEIFTVLLRSRFSLCWRDRIFLTSASMEHSHAWNIMHVYFHLVRIFLYDSPRLIFIITFITMLNAH